MADALPVDHGSDRFDYIEVQGPADQPLPAWLTDDFMPCSDCRANAFLKWDGESWALTIAHDDGCPTLAREER